MLSASLQRPRPSAGGVAHVVLDEADKMLSLGLKPQLDRLHALLLPPPAPGGAPEPGARARPQVQLWTATMPDALRAAAAPWLLRPRRVRASASAADQISRSVVQARRPACRAVLVRALHICADAPGSVAEV